MRLYLSSYRLGNAVECLAPLVRGARACIVANALDLIPNESRVRYAATVYDPVKEFAGLGIRAEYLDLRSHFHSKRSLVHVLKGYDLVWVLGGNAFLLMRAMVLSGFDETIRTLLAEDAIAYGGFSAGAVVASPTLRGIDLMDNPAEIAEGYPPAPVWDGLGLVDFSIVPHFNSSHPEAALAEVAARYFADEKLPFKTLQDGDVWIQDGGVGKLWKRGQCAHA
jgi:dipeptidase E